MLLIITTSVATKNSYGTWRELKFTKNDHELVKGLFDHENIPDDMKYIVMDPTISELEKKLK